LLEFRLFADEPRLIARAQWQVIRGSLRLLRLLAVPAAVLTLPMLIAIGELDAVFGHAPLGPGGATVVTAEWSGVASGEPRIEAGDGFRIETPAVRVAVGSSAEQFSWRLRPPSHAALSQLRLLRGGQAWTKSVRSGNGPSFVSVRRLRWGAGLARYPTEVPLQAGAGPQWIEVQYPEASVAGLPWYVWFVLFSAAGFFLRP
jgi:hypothetical protein